jgi:hypothetical protein
MHCGKSARTQTRASPNPSSNEIERSGTRHDVYAELKDIYILVNPEAL